MDRCSGKRCANFRKRECSQFLTAASHMTDSPIWNSDFPCSKTPEWMFSAHFKHLQSKKRARNPWKTGFRIGSKTGSDCETVDTIRLSASKLVWKVVFRSKNMQKCACFRRPKVGPCRCKTIFRKCGIRRTKIGATREWRTFMRSRAYRRVAGTMAYLLSLPTFARSRLLLTLHCPEGQSGPMEMFYPIR